MLRRPTIFDAGLNRKHSEGKHKLFNFLKIIFFFEKAEENFEKAKDNNAEYNEFWI